MPRKRTPSKATPETEATNPTTVAEPEPATNDGPKQSFAERVGQKKERVSAPDPFGIAGDYAGGVRLFESRRDGVMAIKFDAKPNQAVLDRMKVAATAGTVWTRCGPILTA